MPMWLRVDKLPARLQNFATAAIMVPWFVFLGEIGHYVATGVND